MYINRYLYIFDKDLKFSWKESFQSNWLSNKSLKAQAYEFLSENDDNYPLYIILHQSNEWMDPSSIRDEYSVSDL